MMLTTTCTYVCTPKESMRLTRQNFLRRERKSNDVDVGIIARGGLRRVGEMLLSCFLVTLTGGASSRRGNDNGAEYQRCDQSLQ